MLRAMRGASAGARVLAVARPVIARPAPSVRLLCDAGDNPLAGSKTHLNLKDCLASLSMNAQRYEFMAQQADCDGLAEVASLLRSVAKGESSQAMGTLEFLLDVGDPATDKPMGDTASNLEAACASEEYEGTQLFPSYAETARKEGHEEIADWFDTLAHAQTNHWESLKSWRENLAGEPEEEQ